ncbi:MAG TPA: winged helix-turn-helix domain-containing protein [Pyrinomonadaceae bacterium]|nr:winged helix-turn-helix domain-containing protein [Pyrinomonadaceae bacterium]
MTSEKPHFYEFGPFRLDPSAPFLWREGRTVTLTPKALETLVVLVKHGGHVVSREELIEAVWPDTVVEENNLSVNVSMLRKALGEGEDGEKYIETVPRRGYRFTATVWDVPVESVELTFTRRTWASIIETKEVETIAGVEHAAVSAGSLPGPITEPVNQRRRRTSRLIAVLAVFLFAIVAVYFNFGGRFQSKGDAGIPAVRSIAVLPLKAITKSEDDEPLSLGLAESLIARLGGSQKIIMRPLSLTAQYTRAEYDALEVGRRLQVDAILDGSFQRDDKRLRVRVRLLRVADGQQIWVGTFDEIETDIFKLQDAISLEAASALALNLNKPQRELILKRYTENTEAYQAYLRGAYLLSKSGFDSKNIDLALAEYERALQLDPSYALAHTGLANAYARRANSSSGDNRRQLYEKAKAAALTALALDENLAEAHSSLGWVRRIYDWDWAESERHMMRAIELAPNEARFRRSYVFLLITLGRTAEAVAEARKAHELEPTYNSIYAFALSSNRQTDEAIVEYLKATELNNDLSAWDALADQYFAKGDYAEALRVSERAPPQAKSRERMKMLLAMVYFRSGEKEKAEEIVREFEATARGADGHDTQLAALYAAIGRKDDAIAALQRGVATRDDRMMWIKTNPHFDTLRDDPRFQEILRNMRLQK